MFAKNKLNTTLSSTNTWFPRDNTCLEELSSSVGTPKMGNTDGIKHFLWQSCMSLNLCVVLDKKMTLCPIHPGRRLDKCQIQPCVMTEVQEGGVELNEFVFPSRYNVYFWTITLWKCREPPYSLLLKGK